MSSISELVESRKQWMLLPESEREAILREKYPELFVPRDTSLESEWAEDMTDLDGE
jgi:hypothetical protein